MLIREYLQLPVVCCRACLACWRPEPVAKPVPPVELGQLPFLSRSARVLHFTLLQLEYRLCRGGGLREWAKLNLLMALIVGIPSVLLLPLGGAIATSVLHLAVSLQSTMAASFFATLYGLGTLALLTAAALTVRAYLELRK